MDHRNQKNIFCYDESKVISTKKSKSLFISFDGSSFCESKESSSFCDFDSRSTTNIHRLFSLCHIDEKQSTIDKHFSAFEQCKIRTKDFEKYYLFNEKLFDCLTKEKLTFLFVL